MVYCARKRPALVGPLCVCSSPLMLRPMYTLIHALPYIFRLLLDLLVSQHLSDHQKDLEILLLRQQLRIAQRRLSRAPRISVWEKGILALLAVQFSRCSEGTGKRLDQVILLFKPETVLRWHRALVRRKWTFPRDRRSGRPPVAADLEELIVRLATENPRWGYSKIQGELLKLGYTISRSTVRNVLKRRRIPPSTQRNKRGTT